MEFAHGRLYAGIAAGGIATIHPDTAQVTALGAAHARDLDLAPDGILRAADGAVVRDLDPATGEVLAEHIVTSPDAHGIASAHVGAEGDMRYGKLIISEVNATACVQPTDHNWVEVYNTGRYPLPMHGRSLTMKWSGGSAVYQFPCMMLDPGAYVVVHEETGSNTTGDLYMGTVGAIGWAHDAAGSCALTGSDGSDFVRWAGSRDEPPVAGTWIAGTDPGQGEYGRTLGRDSAGTDTDRGLDWAWQAPTGGAANAWGTECFTIGGRVTAGGVGLFGVSLQIEAQPPQSGASTATSGSGGEYRSPCLPPAVYRVTPARTGYSFEPAFRDIDLTANTEGVDFSTSGTGAGEGLLYLGVNPDGAGRLETYDLSTGGISVLGTGLSAGWFMDTSPGGDLYGVDGAELYLIDPQTAQATYLGPFTHGDSSLVARGECCRGLTFAPDGELVILTRRTDATQWLYLCDTQTLALRTIGQVRGAGVGSLGGLEYADGAYYAGGSGLYRIDGGSAASTQVGPAETLDLDFGPDGILRGTGPSGGLWRIDPRAGTGSHIGPCSATSCGVASGVGAPSFSICGQVTRGGRPLQGATVRLDPGGRTATSGPDGAYAFSALPAGDYTVSASAPGLLFIPTGTDVKLGPSAADVDFQALAADGGFAWSGVMYVGALGSGGGALDTYDLQSQEQSHIAEPFSPFPALDVAPDGELYGIDQPCSLVRVDPVSGAELECVALHTSTAELPTTNAITFAPDGTLYAACWDGGARLYRGSPTTGEMTLIGSPGTPILGLEYAEGTLYAVSSGGLYTLDTATGAMQLVGGTGSQVADLDCGPDRVMRGAGSQDTVLLSINLATGAATGVGDLQGPPVGLASGVRELHMDGYAVAGRVTRGGQPLAGVTIVAQPGGRTTVTAPTGFYALLGLPAGDYTVTAQKTGYDLRPPSQSATLGPDRLDVNFAALLAGQDADGLLYLGTDHSGSSLDLYDLSSGTLSTIGSGIDPTPIAMDTTPDGRLYILNGSALARVDHETGAVVERITLHEGGQTVECRGLAFSENDELYTLTYRSGAAELLRGQASTGELTEVPVAAVPSSSSFAPRALEFVGGRLYAAGYSTPGLWLVDVQAEVARLINPDTRAYDLDMAADGVLRGTRPDTMALGIVDRGTGAWTDIATLARRLFGIATGAGFVAAWPPQVFGIMPGSGMVGSTVSCTVTGERFSPGAAVRLRGDGEPDILGDNVSVHSPQGLTVDFDLTGAAPGRRDLVVTNPNHQSGTFAGGFRVTAFSELAVADVTARRGQHVTLRATLTGGGGPLAGRSLAFSVAGGAVGSATTGSDGVAQLGYTVTQGEGSYLILVLFAGDEYRPSSGAGRLLVLPPGEVWVDDDYSAADAGGHAWQYDAFATVQEGVDAVPAGGTVHVLAGTYVENVSVDKVLTLDGAGSDVATIQPGTGKALTLRGGSDGALVVGFSLAGTDCALLMQGLVSSPITVRNCLLGGPETIRLNASTVGVDATAGNVFAGATDDEAIEARVWHFVDDPALGFVDWGQGAPTETALLVPERAGHVGDTVQLEAKLTCEGQPLVDKTIAFRVGDGASAYGETDAVGVARALYTIPEGPAPRVDQIRARFAGLANYRAVEGSADLSVAAAPALAITLTLDPDTLVAGEVTTATVMDNRGIDITTSCTYAIPAAAGGARSGNRYTSAKAGTWTVTATYGPLGSTAQLTVGTNTTAAPASVHIAPEEAAITMGQTQTYGVTATDAAGNTWTPAAGDITWAGGAGAFTGYTYTPAPADEGSTLSLTATVNGISSPAASLTVYPEGGPGMILAWDVTQQAFYLCANPLAPETGQPIAGTNGTHTYSIDGPDDVTVVVSGTSSNRTVSVAGLDVSNSLQVRWYVRSGAVYQAIQYSTIAGVGRTATYRSGRTCVDGTYRTGFWGLTHEIAEGGVTCGCTEQP